MSRRPVPSRLSMIAAVCAAALTSIGFAADAYAGSVTADQIGGSRALVNCIEHMQHGDTSDETLAVCDTALREQLRPDQRMAILINRGVIRVRRQQYDLALAAFDEALRYEPNNTTALFNRGMTQVQLRQNGPAVATLTQALSLGMPSPYLAYYYRGVARERLGDARGAYEDYSTALEIQPNWAPAEQEMARFARGRQQELASQVNEAPRP